MSQEITENAARQVTADVVRLIERYNRSLSLVKLSRPEPTLASSLVTYLINATTVTLFFFLMGYKSATNQWYNFAWALCIGLLMGGAPFVTVYRHDDSARKIYEDPEEAAVAAGRYPHSEPISLAPLSATDHKSNRAYINSVFSDDFSGHVKHSYVQLKEVTICVIARLRSDSVLARYHHIV